MEVINKSLKETRKESEARNIEKKINGKVEQMESKK